MLSDLFEKGNADLIDMYAMSTIPMLCKSTKYPRYPYTDVLKKRFSYRYVILKAKEG